jgi:CSLREA domain-containing protein
MDSFARPGYPLLALVAIAAFLAIAPSAQAVNFPVTKTADTNDGNCNADCSIREAIAAAGANGAGADVVTIPASPADYVLSGATGLNVTDQNLTIRGAGTASTQINGAGLGAGAQILAVHRTTGTVDVTVEDLTLKGMNDGGGGGALHLSSNGDSTNKVVRVNRVSILNNVHNDGGGGAIGVFGGELILKDSTLAGNQAGSSYGGGGIILITSGSKATVDNSTITNNSGGTGAGIRIDGGFGAPQSLVVRNSTITGNNSTGSAGIAVGATTPVQLSYNTISGNISGTGAANQFFGAATTLKGNIFVGNTAQNCDILDAVNPTRQGFNFDSANTCRLGTAPGVNPNDHPNTTVALSALADNGGPTFTQALPAGSAAIDAGGLGGCTVIGGAVLATDQRGLPRPGGAACDSGAFEVQPPAPPGGGGGGGGGGGTGGTGGGGGTPTGPTAIAALSNLAVTPKSFVAASSGGSIAQAAAKGTTVSYSSTQPATTTFRVQRRLRGFRVRGRCVARRPAGVTRPRRCVLFRRVRGSFKHVTIAGQNSFRFTGRIRGRKLRPGAYRLNAVARNSFGASSVRRAAFRIKRR